MSGDASRGARYTVFNIEMDDAETDEHVSGLTAADAARVLLERCSRRTEFRQIDGQWALVIESFEGDLDTVAYAAAAVDDIPARAEIDEALAVGRCMLPSPYVSMTDQAYWRGRHS